MSMATGIQSHCFIIRAPWGAVYAWVYARHGGRPDRVRALTSCVRSAVRGCVPLPAGRRAEAGGAEYSAGPV